MRRALVLSTLVFALALSVSIAAKQRAVRHRGPAPVPQSPTFSNEVVRIFQQHCQSCHREGDIAPFPLMTYQDAAPRAAMIKFMTQSRHMPPWKPEEGCGEFEGERRLTEQELDTIAKWADAGAPEGNRAQLPPPADFGTGWRLGEPHMILANPEPYTAPAGTDTYRCFTIPTNLISTAYVSAIDTHPGDRSSVHHVIAFIDTTGASAQLDAADPGPGYTCFGGPGFNNPGTLGGWAPGSPPLELPNDVGFELPANSRVVLQVHYHPHHGETRPDRTEVGLYFAKEKPSQLMHVIPIVNTTFTIPPNNSNYRVDAQLPIAVPFPLKLWFVAPHMHLLGKKMRVEMTAPGGAKTCLINIEDWDFNWQGAYRYKNPVRIPTGARLSLTAYYDNSESNPRNPSSPPKPVSWGEATTDEMCIAFLGVTID